ncbi:hypothetical protein PAV_5c02760 [Paenibacillus alvei DSM 29]|nr:hypothetical protein PAV_5c02760 [Paenibacillus alvei DSM 29]
MRSKGTYIKITVMLAFFILIFIHSENRIFAQLDKIHMYLVKTTVPFKGRINGFIKNGMGKSTLI